METLDVFYAVLTGCVVVVSFSIYDLVTTNTDIARIRLARKKRKDKARQLAEKSPQPHGSSP